MDLGQLRAREAGSGFATRFSASLVTPETRR
jgi:hypothetical protein